MGQLGSKKTFLSDVVLSWLKGGKYLTANESETENLFEAFTLNFFFK